MGKISFGTCHSYFFYQKGSDFRRILHLLKYGGRKDLGEIMGRFMAAELLESGFFRGIDVIVPFLCIPVNNGYAGTTKAST